MSSAKYAEKHHFYPIQFAMFVSLLYKDFDIAYFGAKGKSWFYEVLYLESDTQINKCFVIFTFIFCQLFDDFINHFLIISKREDVDIFCWWFWDFFRLPSAYKVRFKRIMFGWDINRRLKISFSSQIILFFSVLSKADCILLAGLLFFVFCFGLTLDNFLHFSTVIYWILIVQTENMIVAV
jgi:hypothetical protein